MCFILASLSHSIRSKELFWDFYYFVKFFLMPATNEKFESAEYYARDQWPKFDYVQEQIHFIDDRSAKSKDNFELKPQEV